jgi:indolepyruvate ferredoxin oxidoreductase beta subunit
MRDLDILIVGVGGQGTVLASKICGYVAEAAGMDVKLSEIHGMSQRGGSVVTHVRMGEKVYSPLIAEGKADIILAFEELEALRWLNFLKPDGKIILNTQKVLPMPVIVGNAEYPKKVVTELKDMGIETYACDATGIAHELGNSKAANVVLIGNMAKQIGLDKKIFLDAIRASVKPKFIDLNIAAFEAGYNL